MIVIHMSGMFFDIPAVRFSRRLSFFQIRMRYVVALLFRWLTGANRLFAGTYSRPHKAEYPLALETAYELLLRTFRGSGARGGASGDARRSPNINNYNNWLKVKDQHDISFIWEKWPAFTRRLPQKERQQSLPPSKRAIEGAGEKISLAEDYLTLFWRKTGCKAIAAPAAANIAQWFRNFAAIAQARVG